MSSIDVIPVLCFPHAGAGKLYYAGWRPEFGAAVDLRIVQYPRREQRMNTPMPQSVHMLADEIFVEFADVLEGTYAVWGHSMGSILAYEVVRLCQERLGNAPLVFFSSGSSAPCDGRFTRVADLDTHEGFYDVLRHYGGLSEANLADPEFMKYFSSIIKADLRMMGSYEETSFSKLRCPIVLMEGRDDTVASDRWGFYTDHPLEITEFDGGHFFLEEKRSEMASLMSAKIQLFWQLSEVQGSMHEGSDAMAGECR